MLGSLMRIGGSVAALAGMIGWATEVLAAEPIRIGSFVSTTGPASFLGEPSKKALELFIDKFNKDGGVQGRKIELILYDDAGAPEKAAALTKRLIENDHVDVIIGGNSTPASLAAIPLVEQAGIPFISLAGAVTLVEPPKKWVFKTPHTDRMAAEKVFSDMKRRKITKVALISDNGGFGRSGRDESLKVASSYGIEVVADETFGAKDPDVTAQLTKIRGTPGVQAVFAWGFGQGPAILTKNYRSIGLDMPLYHSHGVASKEFIRLVGDASDGVRLPASGLVVSDQLPASDPQKIVAQSFKSAYEGAYKIETSTFAGYAFDALQIALAAINRAGGTDKARVRDEIEKTSGYVGTAGTVTMGPASHMGLDQSSFHMVEIRKGNWVVVD